MAAQNGGGVPFVVQFLVGSLEPNHDNNRIDLICTPIHIFISLYLSYHEPSIALSEHYYITFIYPMMASSPDPEVNISLGTLSAKHLIG
jgi:hypothetical protein